MPSDTPDHGGPDPSESKNGLNATITQGVVDTLKNPDLLPVEFKNWLPQYVDLNMLQHGYRHRNTGPDPIPIPDGVQWAFGQFSGRTTGFAVTSTSATEYWVDLDAVWTNDSSSFGMTAGQHSVRGLQIKQPGIYLWRPWTQFTTVNSWPNPTAYAADMLWDSVNAMIGSPQGGWHTRGYFAYSASATTSGPVSFDMETTLMIIYDASIELVAGGPPDDVIEIGYRYTLPDSLSLDLGFYCFRLWGGRFDAVNLTFSDVDRIVP